MPARGGDRWVAPDKAKHLVVSAALVWAAYRVYHGELHNDGHDARWVAGGFTGVVGIGKEIHDVRFSTRDLVADGVGAALGLLFLTH